MDVHRCRFVPYPVSAINALAFSHPSTSTKQRDNLPVRLAVGRANGDIEIWNPLNGNWHQEVIIHGGKDRSIDGLAWTSEPDEQGADGKVVPGRLRLFSIGYTTSVTEWDLETLRAKRNASGQHGDIWCLGAQPLPDTSKLQTGSQGQRLVAGTIDGCLALYSTDDDDLQLQRVIVKSPSKKTRMISMAFQSRQVVIVGCSDSSIRVYDLRNGAIIRKMTLGSDLVGGAKEIIAWSVKCLPNGDIVSGDSTGRVCIWDGKTYTLVQRIQSHEQDVLSLATSVDGSSIFSGGMDRRTVLYRPVAGTSGRWAKASHRRYHKHDVKAMASFEGEGLSVLVSGGPDANPVIAPLRKAGLENHRTLPFLPQIAPLASAPAARMLLSWWNTEVFIWTLVQPVEALLGNRGWSEDSVRNHKMVARILLKGDANITSASISRDGRLLVVATAAEIKAFKLSRTGDTVKVAKIEQLPSQWRTGASAVRISPDCQWVCAVQAGSKVTVAKVGENSLGDSVCQFDDNARALKRFRRSNGQQHLSGLRLYDQNITHVAFAPDSRLLAVADLSGFIETWILKTADDAARKGRADDSSASSSEGSDADEVGATDEARWQTNPRARLLPRLPAAPAVLSFSELLPSTDDDYTLLTVTISMQMICLNPILGSITDWSRRNPASRLPDDLRLNRDVLKGAIWQGSRVWLYGVSSLFMLDLSIDYSDEARDPQVQRSGQPLGRKRKREKNSGAGEKMAKGLIEPRQVQSMNGDAAKQQLEDVRMTNGGQEAQDEDDDSEDDHTILQLRESQNKQSKVPADGGRQSFWCTYKYRPILGIVPLDSQNLAVAADSVSPGSAAVELAVVERPSWDVDLPPRYLGKTEYER